jgi:hypothetical protein
MLLLSGRQLVIDTCQTTLHLSVSLLLSAHIVMSPGFSLVSVNATPDTAFRQSL